MEDVFDEQQLVADAAVAMAQGRSDEALALLQCCLAEHPASATAHHLIAAQYAQDRRYDDARRHFVLTLRHAPHMHEARLQFGLLLLTLNDAAGALAVLRGIDPLGLPPVIAAYVGALCALAENRVSDALALLDEGLASGHPNVALNADMQQLRLQARQALGLDAAAPESAPAEAVDHVLLHAYGSARK
jgi:tetratricopeptide (TPR) repeat protein